MEFFNRKEEVLDIQLTQYGKYLLSKGKFQPKFYAFYDGDLTYDSNYGGFDENQVESEGRIKETPRIKALHAFEGAETRIKKITQTEATINLDIDEKAILLQQVQPTQTRVYGLGGQLGSSALTSDKAPAWNVSIRSGELVGTSTNYTGSIRNELIPQLDVVLETIVKPMPDPTSGVIDDESLGDSAADVIAEEQNLQFYGEFDDGSSFEIKSETFVADITEVNSPLTKINFDIEVFEVEEDENGNEELILLKFGNNFKNNLKKDLAMSNNGLVFQNSSLNPQEDRKFAEYFFNINFDAQIERPASSISRTDYAGAVPEPTIPPSTILLNPANNFVCPDEINAFETDEGISGGGGTGGGTTAGTGGGGGGGGSGGGGGGGGY